MTDIKALRARAWLMRNVRPYAPCTAALASWIGPQRVMALIQANEAPPAVMAEVVRSRGDEAADLKALETGTYRLITPESREWPTARFAALTTRAAQHPEVEAACAPLGLWVHGTGSLADYVSRSVALTGSQSPTNYGEYVAMEFASALGTEKTRVITGAVRGIEVAALGGSAHPPVVVLRSGLDGVWAREHLDAILDGVVQRGGLVVSAEPISAHWSKQTLARQSWLLAALTEATVIVEARATAPSGPRETAPVRALKRPLFAVPGPVTSGESAGTHALLKEGVARIATNARDVLDVIRPEPKPQEG